jgi:hypothetical protein
MFLYGAIRFAVSELSFSTPTRIATSEPVRNHVDDPIGEMGVDPDVRMLCQKRCEGRGNPLPPKGHG